MPLPDIESIRIVDKAQEFQCIVVVVKRLADAHHHNVGNALTGVVLCGNDLTEHFRRLQIAY